MSATPAKGAAWIRLAKSRVEARIAAAAHPILLCIDILFPPLIVIKDQSLTNGLCASVSSSLRYCRLDARYDVDLLLLFMCGTSLCAVLLQLDYALYGWPSQARRCPVHIGIGALGHWGIGIGSLAESRQFAPAFCFEWFFLPRPATGNCPVDIPYHIM